MWKREEREGTGGAAEDKEGKREWRHGGEGEGTGVAGEDKEGKGNEWVEKIEKEGRRGKIEDWFLGLDGGETKKHRVPQVISTLPRSFPGQNLSHHHENASHL